MNEDTLMKKKKNIPGGHFKYFAQQSFEITLGRFENANSRCISPSAKV